MRGVPVVAVSGPLLRFLSALAILFTGSLGFSLLAFLTQVLLVRQLPVAEVGLIAALVAVINLLAAMATAGVNYFLLQSFGREGWAAARWIYPCTKLTASATVVSALMLIGYVLLRGGDKSPGLEITLLAAIAMLFGQVFVEFASCRFQLEGRYSGLSAWQGVTQTGRFVVVLATGSLASMHAVLAGYAAVGIVTSVASALLLRDLLRCRLKLQGHPERSHAQTEPVEPSPSLVRTALHSLPFALMTMFYLVYFQGPIVILEWLSGGAAAGVYNSAFLIISAMSLIPTVIYMKFLLPKICRWAEHDRSVFRAAFHVGVPTMMLVGCLLMLLVMLVGPWILPALFGQKFVAAVPALMILALSIPFRFAQTVYSSLFNSPIEMTRKVRYLGYSAIIGAGSSLLLVPSLGINGAAAATLSAEVALLLFHIGGTARFIDGINVGETFRLSTFRSSLRHLMQ